MIKNEHISSFEDFKMLIKKVQERRIPGIVGFEPFKQEYYRGQSKNIDSYKLKPTIARKISELNILRDTEVHTFQHLKEAIIKYDKGQFIRKSPDNFLYFNDWELLWQAQHLELPTRLLDWSLKSEVALYFAIGNPKNDGFDGQFWILYVEDKYQDKNYSYLDHDPFEYQKTILLNPYFNEQNDYKNHFGEIRRMRQHGRFLFQSHQNSLIPLEEQDEFRPFLEKYIIPKEKKAHIRERILELKEVDFTDEVLLPKIDLKIKEEIDKIILSFNL